MDKAELRKYVIARLGEASTWRGLVLILTAFGIALSPEQVAAITTIGLGLSGLIGAMIKDKP